MRLYGWQEECLLKWEQNSYRGIVNVATGAGKTVLALAAVKRLEEAFAGESVKVKIIVPKIFLVRQWFYALKDFLDAGRGDIGVFLGSHKGDTGKKYMIYVINSARYSFAGHMAGDNQSRVFLIADECHRYGADENSKIFDFIKLCPERVFYSMGLSATPNSRRYADVLAPCLGKEIYRFSFVQAIEAGVISRFSLFNIRLEFDAPEREEYDEMSEKLSVCIIKLKQKCPKLNMKSGGHFFTELENIIKTHSDPEVCRMAQTLLLLMYRRKEIVYLTKSRIQCVTSLVKRINESLKIIIFGERIETANEIYKKIDAVFPGKAGLYHSKMHETVRKRTLRDFEDSRIRILVSCKTLDEGLNVSDTDIGIVASSTGSERQRIQRLGRVLRNKDGGGQACFYYLYVGDTMEESEVFSDLTEGIVKSVKSACLSYDDTSDSFADLFYPEMTEDAVSRAVRKSWSAGEIDELKRNIELAVVAADRLADEDICVQKIKEALCKRERNYYIAALLLIKASKIKNKAL